MRPYEEMDSDHTLVFGGKRPAAAIGVQDTVIVLSGHALLVCARKREQDVGEIVEQLKTPAKVNSSRSQDQVPGS